MHLDTIRRMYQKGPGPRETAETLMEFLDILPNNVLSKSHIVGFYTIKGTQMCNYEVRLLLEGKGKFISKLRQRMMAKTT